MCSQGGERYKGIHFEGFSNHNMASDFRVSSRSNENTDGRCDREKVGGSGFLRHLDSSNNLMMVGGSGVLRHLDSSIDAMDLVEVLVKVLVFVRAVLYPNWIAARIWFPHLQFLVWLRK